MRGRWRGAAPSAMGPAAAGYASYMTARTRPRPETWHVDAGDADVATLTVPPVLHGERCFDIDVRAVARVAPEAGQAWLALQLDIDGLQEWSRRIDAVAPSDTLDHHCRRVVPPGQALRVRARAAVGQARRQRLTIEVCQVGADDA